jgi:hypothetical protein
MPVAGGPFIQKTGILLEVDAADRTSYPGTGTTWTNQIRPGTFNGTLNNISFNSSDANGALVFTGSNTFVDFGNLGPSLTSSFSFQVAFKPAATASGQPYTILSYASSSATSSITFKLDYTSSNQTVVLTTFAGTGSQNTVYALSASVSSGSWNIVHGTFGSQLAALYVNGLGQVYAPTTGSTVGYNTSNRLYAGLNFGSTVGYYTGSLANITVNNADLDGLTVNKNYNAIATRFSLPVRRPIVTDADAFNFVEIAGIGNEIQQSAINTLVLGLKANNLWTKMQAIYPFVGGTAFTHKFNLKDPRDTDAAFRIQFFGAVTHNNLGVSASAAGYGDTRFVPTASFANISSSIHAAVLVSSRAVTADVTYTSLIGDYDNVAYGQADLHIGRESTTGFNTNAYAFSGYNGLGLTTATMDGLYVATRTTAAQMEAYKRNATETINASGGSTFQRAIGTIGANTIRLFRGYLSNNYTTGVLYQYASIGTGLTQTDVNNLYTLLTAFNNTLGRS